MKFVNLPRMNKKRTIFKFKPSTLTTMNAGDLVPMYQPIEVIPGDTFKVRSNIYIEVTTFLRNVLDNLYMDIYWFFVPFRLVWSNFVYFYGENKQDPYDSIGTYTMPQVEIPEGGYEEGTIANYMAIPLYRGGRETSGGEVTKKGVEINALAFRGYASIVNEFFIADYVDSKANVNYDIDATILGSNGTDYVDDLVKGGHCFKVNKLHDKYTSALPKPQAGESVPLPLGNNAPVYPGTNDWFDTDNPPQNNINIVNEIGAEVPSTYHIGNYNSKVALIGNQGTESKAGNAIFSNLYADLSEATQTTIGDLRNAIALQHALESESRHGNRFFEQLVGDYGVYNPDLRIQRPEYLGGSRFMLNINPVVQTSQTNSTPQGNLTSYSVTTWSHKDFTKSFQEPGLLLVLGTIRYKHTYSQGLPKFFSKKDKYDLFNPHFDGIGEQPIYNKELYLTNTSDDEEVFGYMPYGTEYRTLDKITTGEMSPDSVRTLDSYHFGDDYETTPALSPDWLKEDKNNIDRTLTISSENAMQFQLSIGWNVTAWRELSAHGTPGLKYL